MERSVLEMLSDRSSALTLLGCRPSARKSLGRSQKRFQLLTKSSFCSLHHDNNHSFNAKSLLNLSCPFRYVGSGPDTMIVVTGDVLCTVSIRLLKSLSKVDDLENRSRRSNLRLVNLPEKVEKGDAAAFLEKWLPDVLGPETFPAPLIIERAHRLPGAPQSSAPRVMILKFLNFRDKIRVMQAARKKGKIMYEGHHVMLFQDISTDLEKDFGFSLLGRWINNMGAIMYRLWCPIKCSVKEECCLPSSKFTAIL